MGEVALVAVPVSCSMNSCRHQRESPFHTVVIELANDSIGYVPRREDYANGGYEVVTAWPQAAAEQIVETALGLLKRLRQ